MLKVAVAIMAGTMPSAESIMPGHRNDVLALVPMQRQTQVQMERMKREQNHDQ
jgi:hypothetical protein